jgi:hypothetical protein
VWYDGLEDPRWCGSTMIKALLIVVSLNGGGDYRVEMPTMESCLDMRSSITKQDNTLKTLCIPKEDDSDKFKAFLSMFTEMVREMKEMESNDKLGSDGYRETNRQCNDGSAKC